MGRPKKAVKEPTIQTGGWGSENVKCPFWRGETEREICCEGLCPRETIRRLLPSREAKKAEESRFCCRSYEACPIYKLVCNKYS